MTETPRDGDQATELEKRDPNQAPDAQGRGGEPGDGEPDRPDGPGDAIEGEIGFASLREPSEVDGTR